MKLSKGALNVLAVVMGIVGFIVAKIAGGISEKLLDIKIAEKVQEAIKGTNGQNE